MSVATLTTFCVYIVGMLAIGIFAYLATNSLGDYILGGRRLGPAVTALSAGASDMSGWLLLGVPGAVYLSGLGEAWIVIGLVIGAWLNWSYVAHPLRVSTESLQALTLPDYFEARFKDKSNLLRLLSAVVILVFFTFYAASGMVAGATLFSTSFGLSYLTSLLLGAFVIVTYTMIGGFLAVSWTDFIQGLLMLFALVAVPLVMLMELGGPGQALVVIDELRPGYSSLFSGATLLGVVSLMAWGLGYFGQPHILVRFMAIGQAGNMVRAKRIGMSWMILSTAGALAVGLFGIAYLAEQGVVLADADTESVFIVATQLIFNPWLAGILLAGILAAVMSTIDSQLLVSSSALSEDFYKTWLRPGAGQTELVIVGRITVLMIAVIATVIALDPGSKVLGLVSYAWAGLGASFGPVILLSLYWQGMSRDGALAGMLTGALTVVVWKQLQGGPFDVYEILPGFILSALMIVLVSKLSPRS
ncbi:MAG: sodium/proline symporter PutP [Pseudomonadales bacterium]